MRKHARAYIRRGWSIVQLWWPTSIGVCACPKGNRCGNVGKHPMYDGWSKHPMKTGLEIDLYWSRYPNANIGIVTGAASGLIVLDIDPLHGGWSSLSDIVKAHGRIPDTIISVTGSLGRHILFKHPGRGDDIKNAEGFMQGVDIRGDGGQIVAPPSLHGNGRRYCWHEDGHPARMNMSDIPSWVYTFLEMKDLAQRQRNQKMFNTQRSRKLDVDSLPMIGEGRRNTQLCSIAGRLIWEKKTAEEVAQLIAQINQSKCTPPLGDREIATLVKSACRRWI